ERVGRSEQSVAQGVGLVVIEVRYRDGAVGVRPASHREVARSDEYEIAVKHTACTDLALPVDRGAGRMRCADCVHELADGENLPDRADEEIVIGSEIDEHFA